MLRIHFTSDDLARIALISENFPAISETVLGLQAARRGDQRLRFDPWRVSLAGRIPAVVRPVCDLVPADGWIPDFLTPAVGDLSMGVSLDAIRATPARRIRADLDRMPRTKRSAWARVTAGEESRGMEAVAAGLEAFHDVAIAPYTARFQAVRDVELARRTTILVRRGAEGLLQSLGPAVTWRAPVLALPSPLDRDIALAGRGLALAPMVFCGPIPRLYLGDDVAEKPVLVYQAPFISAQANPLAEYSATPPHFPPTSAMGKLMGATRSAVLHAIASAPGLSTAQLAQRAGIALASASEHASVLCGAGLISSVRDGNRVRHYVTATATALLGAAAAARASSRP